MQSTTTKKLIRKTAESQATPTVPSSHWPALIKQWENSGLPQKEFCRANALSYANFVYHRMQLKKAQQTKMPPLLAVQKTPSSLDLSFTQRGFTVQWPNGICLGVPNQADVSTLKLLLNHLGG